MNNFEINDNAQKSLQSLDDNPLAIGAIRTIQNLIVYTGAQISPKTVRDTVRETLRKNQNILDLSLLDLDQILKSWGFGTFAVKVNPEAISQIEFPAIAHIIEDNAPEFVLLTSFAHNQVTYLHPGASYITESLAKFQHKWEGIILMVDGDENIREEQFEVKYQEEKSAQEDYLNKKMKILDDFLCPSDCDQIIKFSEDLYERSKVIADGQSMISNVRTSRSAYLYNLNKDLKDRIYSKVTCMLKGLPYEKVEELQSVSYQPKQEFKTHFDAGKDMNRLYTILIYLNDDFKGGETFFPELSLMLEPKKGKAVLFHNLNKDGSIDLYSLHAGLPVTRGTKYACNIWIRG